LIADSESRGSLSSAKKIKIKIKIKIKVKIKIKIKIRVKIKVKGSGQECPLHTGQFAWVHDENKRDRSSEGADGGGRTDGFGRYGD
jgi:hypothetical protein